MDGTIQQDQKLQSIIERFSRLIEKRYACNLDWQWNRDHSIADYDFQTNATPHLDHALTFSLQKFGRVRLCPRQSLSPLQIKAIKDLLAAVINPTLNLWDQISLLQREESHNLLNLEKEKTSTSNVISLRSKFSQQLNSDLNAIFHYNKKSSHSTPASLPSCIIHAPFTVEIHQIALQLHESTQKSYFIHFGDLKIDFNNPHSHPLATLLPLSSLTVFVPELVQLSPNEEHLLFEWVNHNKQEVKNEFQLIVGTIFPYNQILNDATESRRSLLQSLSVYPLNQMN